MDSLVLPSDLYWDAKTNTLPTLSNDFCLFDDLDVNGFDDANLTTDITMIENDNELENAATIIKDNVLLPVLDIELPTENSGYSSVCNLDVGALETASVQYSKGQISNDTSSYCFGNVDLSTFTQLTPPSSPPLNFCLPVAQLFNLSIAPGFQTIPETVPLNNDDDDGGGFHQVIGASALPVSVLSQVSYSNATYNSDSTGFHSPCPTAATTLSDDELAREIQIVDDILKSAANKFFDDSASQTSVSATSHGDYNTTDDDEWLPSSSPDICSSSEPTVAEETDNVSVKKRQRLCARGPEDRKVRKKEQNKNAATRYRQKKKLEMEFILSEESQLLKRNEDLTRQLKERTNELKYLKKLIREFYRDKLPSVLAKSNKKRE